MGEFVALPPNADKGVRQRTWQDNAVEFAAHTSGFRAQRPMERPMAVRTLTEAERSSRDRLAHPVPTVSQSPADIATVVAALDRLTA